MAMTPPLRKVIRQVDYQSPTGKPRCVLLLECGCWLMARPLASGRPRTEVRCHGCVAAAAIATETLAEGQLGAGRRESFATRTVHEIVSELQRKEHDRTIGYALGYADALAAVYHAYYGTGS
jgi:hypothetical protein